jgi:hypothetical protein
MPPILVSAANNKSVPTAARGGIPKPKIKSGVINEPPPTPVNPTMKPTTSPATIYPSSIGPDPIMLASLEDREVDGNCSAQQISYQNILFFIDIIYFDTHE